MSFIIGFPNETVDDIIATTQFFIDNQVHCDPFFLQPYPGSKYFEAHKDKIIGQYMTDAEKEFLNDPALDTFMNLKWELPVAMPSKSTLMKDLPAMREKIHDGALKRWVLSLDDATKMSCNLTEFTDVELAGLKYMVASWDVERLKKFQKIYEERKNTDGRVKSFVETVKEG
jgi:hypothetical protein